MPGPAYEIPWSLADGGANLSDDEWKGLVRALRSLVEDLGALKTAFDSHLHRVDGTALSATSDITGVPVTGTETGAPDGGTPIAAVTIGTTLETGFDDQLEIGE